MPTRQRRSERSSDSPRFEYSPGSMFSPAPGDLRILWRRPPWGRCVPHPTRVQLAPTPTHGTTRHHAPALPTSTSVAHSTPPDPGSPVVSHSLAHMASQGCSAPTRSARPVTCKDRPHGIYPPRMSGPPTDTTRAVRTGIPPGRDVCTRPHVYQPDSSAPPHAGPLYNQLPHNPVAQIPHARSLPDPPYPPAQSPPDGTTPDPSARLMSVQPSPARPLNFRHMVARRMATRQWAPPWHPTGHSHPRPVRRVLMYPPGTAPSAQKLRSYTPPTRLTRPLPAH